VVVNDGNAKRGGSTTARDEIGLRDLYRELHPVSSNSEAYSLVMQREIKRRYDHAFGSAEVTVTAADYAMGALDAGLSNHAPLVVEVEW